MNDQIKQIAQRIRELREILDVDAADLAKQVNVSVAEYNQYENAETDIPIGVIYGVAAALNVDPTVLLTGDAPRMSDYTIVRQGRGVSVERYKGYKFSSLAFNYIGRQFDPMIVDLDPMEKPPELVVHGGQEFNYVLKGTVQLVIGSREFLLEAGDSAFFNPMTPHGQRAVGGPVKFLTIINE
ncbi:XRE family transcriptional regulator [Anaerotruncus massiliensis (ex Liu et al. 2021)]|uniref:XRE family transcriptional regulator n=2 Tax=Anaerotruncus TaxID=244127 RepID=A0A498CZ57_9FIRM|nr:MULTISPECIES: XRE family transcriptional regulator [Anaerotruncus]MBC3938686.1 helix-turn-helix transcriptional regulator [Anaerotruncus massiliensis (ex Togo et al. 2019)]RLL11658.1 XRE family transcriptional regulator [Anaerotruncus massiliensis (ex Liu et al. 2021)]